MPSPRRVAPPLNPVCRLNSDLSFTPSSLGLKSLPTDASFTITVENKSTLDVVIEELETGEAFSVPSLSTSDVTLSSDLIEDLGAMASFTFQESATFSCFTVQREPPTTSREGERMERMSVIDAFGHACGQSQEQVVAKWIGKWREVSEAFLVECVDRRDNEEEVPLAMCARLGNVKIMALLLAAGASLSAAGSSGRTPLQEACKWGKTAAAVALLDFVQERGDLGCHVDAPSAEDGGRTALHLAVYYGHLDAARTLCSRGADPTVEGEDGKTPLAVGLLFRSARLPINDLLVHYRRTEWKRKVDTIVQLTCLRLELNSNVATYISEFLTADDDAVKSWVESRSSRS